MKVIVVTGSSSPYGMSSASAPKPTLPEKVYLRAVNTQSGDGIAIEASLNSDFYGAERVAKVGTIGANGALAVKRYGYERINKTAPAISLDSNGRIAESFSSPRR